MTIKIKDNKHWLLVQKSKRYSRLIHLNRSCVLISLFSSHCSNVAGTQRGDFPLPRKPQNLCVLPFLYRVPVFRHDHCLPHDSTWHLTPGPTHKAGPHLKSGGVAGQLTPPTDLTASAQRVKLSSNAFMPKGDVLEAPPLMFSGSLYHGALRHSSRFLLCQGTTSTRVRLSIRLPGLSQMSVGLMAVRDPYRDGARYGCLLLDGR
jgi:hypothetical protein